MWSKFNIDSHKRGQRVNYKWLEGMLDTGHTCHVKTRLGTIAVRPKYGKRAHSEDTYGTPGNYRIDFSLDWSRVPAGVKSRELAEVLISNDRREIILWALERLNGDIKPGVEPNDFITTWSNQADREAVVLATDGTDVLLEYTMPGTTSGEESTALRVTTFIEGFESVSYKSVSYKTCPKKWIEKIRDNGLEWDGFGQRGYVPFPKPEGETA